VVDYLPGEPARLIVRALSSGGRLLYEEEIRAGIGEIVVDAASDAQAWRLRGAHRASGTGPNTLTYLAPGDYTIEWLDGGGDVLDSASRDLADGERVVFSYSP
jgi:hypothetical protein